MPRELKGYQCKYCHEICDTKSAAGVCEDSHKHSDKLYVIRLEPLMTGLFFQRGQAMPDRILVGARNSDHQAIYVRIGSMPSGIQVSKKTRIDPGGK